MNWFIIAFFIISIILFLLTKYYLLQKNLNIEEIEAFEQEAALTTSEILNKQHNVTLQYLNSEEASKLIVKDGIYLKGMNQANLSARKCSNIDELYSKYLNAFDNITNKEKDTIDKFVLDLLLDIQNINTKYYNYIIKWLNTISIAKAKAWLEDGMPHTLDKTIVMDAKWFTEPRRSTFVHEIMHVHQRESIMDFEDVYDQLGYVYYPVEIKGLESIYPLNRNNPDGTSKYWLWYNNNSKSTKTSNNYWWIGAIFKNSTPSSLTDANLVALELQSGADGTLYFLKQNPTPLSNLKVFIDFFGENPNNYHPNEMIAKFSELYLEDTMNHMMNENSKYKYEGYKIYKKYFDNMINKYY